MTSALNLRLRLSGNNIFAIAIMATFLFSCAVPKKSTVDPNVQIIKADSNKKTDTENQTKTNTTNKTTKSTKTDTLRWKDVSTTFPPIRSNIPKEDTKSSAQYNQSQNIFKDEYNITLLIPLDSDGGGLPADTRFIQYYAGTLMGLETLENEGIKLNAKIIDTNEGSQNFSDRIEDIIQDAPDLIIGPYEREEIKELVEKCKLTHVPLVSPWQTSTKITSQNPYYIQIKPNLKDHYKKLIENTVQEFKKGEVALIIKNEKEATSIVDFFQQTAYDMSGGTSFYQPYFMSEDSIKKGKLVFQKLFNSGIKAVLFPMYAYEDEDFVALCLKKLAVEKGTKSIEVYGMPLIYESEKIDFEYYHSLNFNVVASEFAGQDLAGVLKFKNNYLQKYGEIPGNEAIRAYDLMIYLGRNLWKHGKTFQYYLWQEDEPYLMMRYNVLKSNADDSKPGMYDEKFDYFENKHLHILKFEGNTWQIKY